MKSLLLFAVILVTQIYFVFSGSSPDFLDKTDEDLFEKELAKKDISYTYTLQDFYSENNNLDALVDKKYSELSNRQRVAELFMPAVGSNGISLEEAKRLIQTDSIGGFMLLGKGVAKKDIQELKDLAGLYKDVPLLVSIDAEPSLVSSRLPEIGLIDQTNTYKTKEEVQAVSAEISSFIKEYGFSLNFAPVYDINKNQAVIGSRSHGTTAQEAALLANEFAHSSMNVDVIPTAKHFPGHGNVIGDSHKLLPVIDSDLVEIGSFESAIKMGIPMIMTGHLAVEGGKYDTNGLPATLSSVIQKDLLREELQFEGVIITDAFNMSALKNFSNNEMTSLHAGADIILMPQTNIDLLIDQILREASSDSVFKKEIEEKVKRVLRLKMATPGL